MARAIEQRTSSPGEKAMLREQKREFPSSGRQWFDSLEIFISLKHHLAELQTRIDEARERSGHDSPEAVTLRERIRDTTIALDEWTSRHPDVAK